MSNRDNIKQILEQIQAELNIDDKDNWDLKQVIVDSIYKLITALVEEITVMQDEIDRAKLQDESFVDTKESKESFDFSEVEDK